MSPGLAEGEVFRFVNVRPPQLASRTDRERHFLAYGAGEQPPVHEELTSARADGAGAPELRDVARGHLAQRDPPDADPAFAKLLAAHAILSEAAGPVRHGEQGEAADTVGEPVRERVERALGAAVDDFIDSDAFRRVRSAAWDHLYASVAAGDPDPQLREKVVAVLRAAGVLEETAAGTEPLSALSPRRLRRLLGRTPMLPDDVFPVGAPTGPGASGQGAPGAGNGGAPPGAGARQGQGVLGEQERGALWERIQALHEARDEITRAASGLAAEVRRRTRDRSEGGSGASPSGRPASEGAASGGGLLSLATNALFTAGDARGPGAGTPGGPEAVRPYVFGETHLDELSETSVEALGEAGIEPDGRPVGEVVEAVDAELATTTQLLFRERGFREVRAVGQALRERGVQGLPGRDLTALPTETALRASRLYDVPLLPDVLAGETGGAEGRDEPTVPSGSADVRVLGVGDLIRVDQTLLRYEAADVSHIENVLASEHKLRKHRRLNRVEQVFEEETVTETERQRDLESTERFEMQEETEETIESESDLQTGVKITGSYGSVKVSSSTDFARTEARSESTSEARSYSREITERAVKKIRKRVSERRKRTTVEETEETNTHGFDNRESDEHVTGVYRWVEKVYEAQLVDYGKRLMLEFVVPEPAALYRHMQANRDVEGVTLEKPEPPEITPSDLRSYNYRYWVDQYEVEGAAPPPARYRRVSTGLQAEADDDHEIAEVHKELEVPEGYVARTAYPALHVIRSKKKLGVPPSVSITVGEDNRTFGWGDDSKTALRSFEAEVGLDEETDVVPAAVAGWPLAEVALTVEVHCERTPESFQQWQLDTYQKIVDAYRKKKAAYDKQVRAAESRQGEETGVMAQQNPSKSEEIEREELKRQCVTLMTGQRFELFDAVRPDVPPHGFPELDVEEARAEGDYVGFFEQAFEWGQMTYAYYPYYWGRKDRWEEVFPLDATHPRFRNFLRAGAARVVVPARPHLTGAVLHFLETGEIWKGSEPPTLDDDLYVSIVTEIKEQKDAPRDGTPVEDPWVFSVPTSLVWLQPGPELPDFTET